MIGHKAGSEMYYLDFETISGYSVNEQFFLYITAEVD